VNISSIVSSSGYSGLSAYSATKASSDRLHSLPRREVGQLGITVNAVAPGLYRYADDAGVGGGTARADRANAVLCVARWGPMTSAAAVEFLLSENAKDITALR